MGRCRGVHGGPDQVPDIPFSASDSTITFRMWSPKPAGTPVLVKVEASDGNEATTDPAAEVTVTTTKSGEWETLTADFAGAFDPAVVYNKFALFPDFGTAGTDEIYYLDQITFPAPPSVVITFDEATPPSLIGFGGFAGAVVADPANVSNKVAELTKGGSETWAGVVVSTVGPDQVPDIPFSASNSTITFRMWSPKPAGTPVLVKVEASDGNEATTDPAAEVTGHHHGGRRVGDADLRLLQPAADPRSTRPRPTTRCRCSPTSGRRGRGRSTTSTRSPGRREAAGVASGAGIVITFDEATVPVLTGFGGAGPGWPIRSTRRTRWPRSSRRPGADLGGHDGVHGAQLRGAGDPVLGGEHIDDGARVVA